MFRTRTLVVTDPSEAKVALAGLPKVNDDTFSDDLLALSTTFRMCWTCGMATVPEDVTRYLRRRDRAGPWRLR